MHLEEEMLISASESRVKSGLCSLSMAQRGSSPSMSDLTCDDRGQLPTERLQSDCNDLWMFPLMFRVGILSSQGNEE